MINNVVLMGRMTSNAEIKTTQSGVEVTSFCIAVDRNYQKKDEEKVTDFINCTAWRSTAAFINKYFPKGSMIALTGEIQTRKYEDKDGNKRTAVEVLVNNVSFCGSKSENKGGSSPDVSVDSTPSDIEEIVDDDEDWPF
ncbi:MAG: single-stranded DNA-binding protein [Clostridia bacterium]|nr:single-stranded DNA-binding protein [Clostridia bacterium]